MLSSFPMFVNCVKKASFLVKSHPFKDLISSIHPLIVYYLNSTALPSKSYIDSAIEKARSLERGIP